MNKNTHHLSKIRSSNKAASDISKESKETLLLLSSGENAEELAIDYIKRNSNVFFI